MCQVYPDRRLELDAYLAIIADLNQRYGGTLFYEYHKAFSAKSAQWIAMLNARIDWSTTDTELLLYHFGGHQSLSCAICSSHGHTSVLCPKAATTAPVYASKTSLVHGDVHVRQPSDRLGRAIFSFNGRPICYNFNESVCSFHNCKFSHICSICRDLHSKSTCPRRQTKAGAIPPRDSKISPNYPNHHCFSSIIPFISPRPRFCRPSHRGPFTRVPGGSPFSVVY